jgi:hypothetical protein
MITQENIDDLLSVNLLPPEDGFDKYDPFKLGQTIGIYDILFPNVKIWCFATYDKALSLEHTIGPGKEFYLEIHTETKEAEFSVMDFTKVNQRYIIEERTFRLPEEFNQLKKVVETYFPETRP